MQPHQSDQRTFCSLVLDILDDLQQSHSTERFVMIEPNPASAIPGDCCLGSVTLPPLTPPCRQHFLPKPARSAVSSSTSIRQRWRCAGMAKLSSTGRPTSRPGSAPPNAPPATAPARTTRSTRSQSREPEALERASAAPAKKRGRKGQGQDKAGGEFAKFPYPNPSATAAPRIRGRLGLDVNINHFTAAGRWRGDCRLSCCSRDGVASVRAQTRTPDLRSRNNAHPSLADMSLRRARRGGRGCWKS